VKSWTSGIFDFIYIEVASKHFDAKGYWFDTKFKY